MQSEALHELAATDYAPRDPDACVVSEVLGAHLGDFLQRVDEEAPDRSLPTFVERELRAIIRCGDFTHGFVRLRCDPCRRDRIVPFSCKSRLCPSCGGRRMADTAAWLVDRVLRPDLRWRQVVVTFPAPIAIGLCFRARLASAVVRVCMRVLFDHQRARASPAPHAPPHPGGIVWIHRFSDGAGAWFHLHILVPDGVFRDGPEPTATFEAQPPPQQSEVDALVRHIARRVTRLVARHTRSQPDDPLLMRCAQQPATALRIPIRPRAARQPRLLARYEGFAVHAGTTVAPHHTEALERLLRYLGRPPLPGTRVERLVDGRVVCHLKRPRGARKGRRGVTRLLMEPIAFIARLAALIPAPKTNLVRYFGVYAPASPLRHRVLPKPPDPTKTRPIAPPRPARMSHADLLMRVFRVDILACSCGARLRVVAVIQKPSAIEAIAAAILLSQPERGPPHRSHRSANR